MTQFTANEVRNWKRAYKGTGAAKVFGAFADLLEAREKAVPVMVVNHVSSAEHDLPIGMKLYTHPASADAEKRETMTPRELAKRIERGEKWKLADEPTPCQSRDADRLAEAVRNGLIDALRHQRQIDEDGAEVGVSRQAVDEAANILAMLAAQENPNG